MQTFWISPTEYVTGEDDLKIKYPSSANASTIVTSGSSGDPLWISMYLPVPPSAAIAEVTVCYQVTNPLSYISQIRVAEMGTPDEAFVLHDDPTDLKSTAPATYVSMVGGKIPTPGKAVSLELRLAFSHSTPADVTGHQIKLGAVSVKLVPRDLCENRHWLGEFGPYGTLKEADAAFTSAVSAIIAQGGGVLCLPREGLPSGFYPRNLEQNGPSAPAVTVIDYRLGVERLLVPPAGGRSSAGNQASHILERDFAENLPSHGVYSTQLIQSRYIGGACSFNDVLKLAAPAGNGAKIYIPSHRGLFEGQTLVITDHTGYGAFETVIVKDLGVDASGNYFVADLTKAHPAGAFAYNKHVVNGVTIDDRSNCDNQSPSLIVNRCSYGAGDTFGAQVGLSYQGDIMSAQGDEGGVGVAAEITHDTECFWGEVESWNPATHELVYKPVVSAPQKLGTSRPIINMSPARWVTTGKALVVYQGSSFMPAGLSQTTLVVGRPGVPWDATLVGRFFAVNEPTEYYEAGEAKAQGFAGKRTYRWWRITAVEPRPDGHVNLFVETVWWGHHERGGPSLFRRENYTSGISPVELSYIIAPGAWVSDVRRAVAGDKPGGIGQATAADPRTIVLTPSASPEPLFSPGDPITNPPGASPWHPIAFRARHFENYPGLMPGVSFGAYNQGKVTLKAGLFVGGPEGSLDDIRNGQKDGNLTYETGVYVSAACQTSIRIRGPASQAGIEFWQPHGSPHKILWAVKGGFPAHSALHADPMTGDFVFEGGDLDHQHRGAVRLSGLSATATSAKNLRGIGVAVAAGSTKLTVAFPMAESDNTYAVMVECSWLTLKSVGSKTTTGFTVSFSVPAPAGAMLDWVLLR